MKLVFQVEKMIDEKLPLILPVIQMSIDELNSFHKSLFLLEQYLKINDTLSQSGE